MSSEQAVCKTTLTSTYVWNAVTMEAHIFYHKANYFNSNF